MRTFANPWGATMALSEHRNDPPAGFKRGPQCTVCITLDALPDDDATTLREWMADPRRTFNWIADQTADDPDTPTLGHHAIARHAKGRCFAGDRLRP